MRYPREHVVFCLAYFYLKDLLPEGDKSDFVYPFIILTAPVSARPCPRCHINQAVKLWEKSVCDKYAEDQNSR